jgi:FkbM family methyltransferase
MRRRPEQALSIPRLLWVDYYSSLRHRVFTPSAFAVSVGGRGSHTCGCVFFGRESLTIDRATFFDVFLEDVYAGDVNGALVIDLGAHKGYFAARALLLGAAEVWSYEPSVQNFTLLERAAESFNANGNRWAVHRAAVGPAGGTAQLHVSGESWAHSLLPLSQGGTRAEVGVEMVEVTALAAILDRAAIRAASRVVVKMDIEGAECSCVTSTPYDAWRIVDEVLMEYHSFAPCPLDALVSYFADAGLELLTAGRRSDDVYHFARSGAATTQLSARS